ncbi:MAG: paraquat-inducible protein A [Bacteroidetes bacterium]|nr:paraquat-inducible protein A [Bacteroidota bacterium]
MKYVIIVISLGLLAAVSVLTTQMITLAKENQELKIDLAEINHARYGLLNADEWKEQVSTILGKKIIEFDLTPENRGELEQSLEVIMYSLLNDLEIIIKERTSGQFSAMKRMVASMVLDVNQLRDSVPSYAHMVLDEINKPATKQGIQTYLQDKLGDLSSETYSLDSMKPLRDVLVKYEATGKSECRDYLKGEVADLTREINQRVMMILMAVLLIFLLNTLAIRSPGRAQSLMLILASFCLLIGGVTTPMIDLEAMIDSLRFQLIGEDVIFLDNIIFFQSKSITDLVEILIRDGSFEMIFVGILVFTFSIIFPILKLISSFIWSLGKERINSNKLIRFFVMKSGKWSMADVMVVAIFMAYIGFNGIVGSQMDSLSQSADTVEIFTTNGTELLGGFYLFLSFCIASLVLSEILTRKQEHL